MMIQQLALPTPEGELSRKANPINRKVCVVDEVVFMSSLCMVWAIATMVVCRCLCIVNGVLFMY